MRARGQKAGFTPRERQILELPEPGRRNKDIAETLGLRPGTDLHRMFGKSGWGRSELALAHLRARTLPSLQTM
jgi:FixJ family two-component response regulator